MPIVGDAAKVHASMVETYGKKKGERIFYATANKQKRKPENWKKAAETHLAEMEALGTRLKKVAVLQARKAAPMVPGIPAPEGKFEFIDPGTGQKPQIAQSQGAPTTPPGAAGTPTTTAAPAGPAAAPIASAPQAQPAAAQMPKAAGVPRAKTASHADLLRTQFRALRLSGVLAGI